MTSKLPLIISHFNVFLKELICKRYCKIWKESWVCPALEYFYLKRQNHIPKYTKTHIELDERIERVFYRLKVETERVHKEIKKSYHKNNQIMMGTIMQKILLIVLIAYFVPGGEYFFYYVKV